MSRVSRFVPVLLGLVLIDAVLTLGPTGGSKALGADAPRPFAVFVDDYFNAAFDARPSMGTESGLHQYDDRLEDGSATAVEKRIASLKTLQARLDKLRAGTLTEDESIDAEILDGDIKSELLSLDVLQTWRHNPMHYVGGPAGSIDGLMKRNFAPPATRLRSVIARLKAAPAMFEALRANVQNPPKEFTDLAIRMGSGTVGFFQITLHDWAKEAAGNNAALFAEFEAANNRVVKELTETVAWMKTDLLPQSHGKYAVGADAFSKKLLYEEMVDIPLDRLLEIGEANLRRDHEAFTSVAAKIDSHKTPAEVMKAIEENHPAADDLIPSAERTIEKTRQFLIDRHIVTVPSEVRPTIMETPPYARSGSFASMDTPGAYETKATEAFYYVTPPEKNWTPKHIEEHLRLYNAPVMQVITIHEAFPGHYIQFLYSKEYPTKTRKLTGCGTNAEGWAHYCEQMALEEGYGDGDPKIQLAQLSEALLRDCRYVVGIKLHTQGMTVEQGTDVFVKQGFQEPANAFEEARRGAYNPTYLYYTLGKLQIYKLREDYRKAKGSDYKLETFHNEFVRQGAIPIKMVRRILLPGNTGPTL
jgi:uncharacterized protein (DUF885 family)